MFAVLRVLDLFSGAGMFALGLERTGEFETIAFSEINPYACKVLQRHWPHVPNLGDITKAEFPDADVITAGFPCQDLSNAGKRAGLAGERSGLWREVVRAIRVVRPRLVLLENVAALLDRGMGDVASDLAASGYDFEYDCIPASEIGAPHNRDRIWIVAYPFGSERRQEPYRGSLGRMGRVVEPFPWDRDWQSALREFRRVDDGTAYRVDRIDCIRNGLVPQIPELLGRAILAAKEKA